MRWRRGGPGRSRRPPSTRLLLSRWRRPGGWTPRSPPSPGAIGPAQLDRLVAETIKRFELAGVDPTADPEDGYLSVDPRHATLNTDDVHYAGTLHFEADLDLADGLDLDRALAHDAEVQKALGSTDSLGRPPAKALGSLARTQTALDLLRRPGADRASGPHPDTRSQDRVNPARSARRSGGRAPRPLHRHHRRRGDRVRSHRAARGRPTPGAARPGQGLVRRHPDQGHHQARHRPHHRPRPRLATRSPTGSASTSSSATAPACSRGAPAPPEAATSTTSSSTTTTPKRKAEHSPARPAPRTSARCAGSTTGSRPTPPGPTE